MTISDAITIEKAHIWYDRSCYITVRKNKDTPEISVEIDGQDKETGS